MRYYDDHKHELEIGMRVRVIRQTKYPYEKLVNRIGVVRSAYDSQVALELDDLFNTKSGKGYYYFKPIDLEIVDDRNNIIMEENNMHNVINYLNVAKIKFIDGNNSGTYDYANFDPYLTVGDLCVVKSAHHGMGLAKVFEIVDRNDIETPREIVARVNTDAYDLRVANRAKAAEIKAKMKERAKQLQDIALYQMLAKDDPDMAELLSEYQALPQF